MAMTNDDKKFLHMKVQELSTKIHNGDAAAANELYDMILMPEDDLMTVLTAFKVQSRRTKENRLLDLETAAARMRDELAAFDSGGS